MLEHAIFFLIIRLREIRKQTCAGGKFNRDQTRPVRAGGERLGNPCVRVGIKIVDGRVNGLVLKRKERCLTGFAFHAAGLNAAFIEAQVFPAGISQVFVIFGRFRDGNVAHGGRNSSGRNDRLRDGRRIVLRGRFFLRRLDFCLLRPFGYGKALVAAAEENQESEK